MNAKQPDDNKARLAELEQELAEVRASLPKHSVPPAMIMHIEELEAEIAVLREAATSNREKTTS